MRGRALKPISRILAAVAIGLFAVSRGPYLPLDLSIFVMGVALAVLVGRKNRRPSTWLLRLAIAAYFYRCVVLFLVGIDYVQAIAIANMAIGLAVIGLASMIEWIRSRPTGPSVIAVPHSLHCVAQDSNGRCGDDRITDLANREPTSELDSRSPSCSPPQFELKAVFVWLFLCASWFAVGAAGGPVVALLASVLGLGWFLGACVVRLVSLGNHGSDARPDGTEPN